MRTLDRALPPVVLDPDACAAWPVRPVIAIAQKTQPAYAWDDPWATWDDPTPLVWDVADVFPAWVDATCDFFGLELETGAPDEHGNFPAAHIVVQLDNRTGRWSQYNADGSPSRFGPGQTLAVWAHNASGDWWLCYTRIARWDERADDSIEVEAFDSFSDLAQPVGTFTPGAAADLPGARLAAILTAAQATATPTRFATGVVHLTAQSTDQAPLEEAQTVTGSDGALLYGDADGTLVSTDRFWRAGRTDQIVEPVISFNVCAAPIHIWDPVLSTNDVGLAYAIVLENVAGLRAAAGVPSPPGRYVLAEQDQQWTSQTEGDTLAAFLLGMQQRTRVALDEFDLYLLDPQQPGIWAAVDWRLFDRVRFLHDAKTPQGTTRLDLEMLVDSIAHSITPGGTWVMTVSTTRALAYFAPVLWDNAAYVWDDTNPLAVWGYS
jgi:hypothetical protein